MNAGVLTTQHAKPFCRETNTCDNTRWLFDSPFSGSFPENCFSFSPVVSGVFPAATTLPSSRCALAAAPGPGWRGQRDGDGRALARVAGRGAAETPWCLCLLCSSRSQVQQPGL